MPVINFQVHADEADSARRRRHSTPNWPDHVTVDEMVAAIDAAGVDGAILVSAFAHHQDDASYAVVSYESAVEPVRLTDRLRESERAMLMGGACAAVYRWSPDVEGGASR